MKTSAIFLCCCVVHLSSCGISTTKPSASQPPAIPADSLKRLHAQLDSVLLDSLFTAAHIGIKVVSVKTREELYGKNVHKLHHPASTMKLITAAAALAKLTPDYRFKTTLYAEVPIVDGCVAGNIYLKGRSDPVFQENDLAKLIHALIDADVKLIKGDIVVDESYLDTVREGPGWMWDDKPLRLSALALQGSSPENPDIGRAVACGLVLERLLTQSGIIVNGEVSLGTVPSTVTTLETHRSPPLAEILRRMNKPSNNSIAELLFKTLGAEVKGEPGTWQKGKEVITEFLSEIGHENTSAFRIFDGSGLSRYNLVNAELLTDLLVAVYGNFEIMPEYLSSMPIAGVDGTLKNRMKGMRAEKLLRAKTGTLSGVSALAGYTITADGEVLAFCIFISHYIGPATRARRIQDELGNYLTRFRRYSEKIKKLSEKSSNE